ncbi:MULTISPECIES: hypothetical protein [Haloferax]|uniref:Uncharacterized protein n=2 Tax=Haloferax TaxID=2251 RepID=A0A6G1Z304_9EURY|nr:MULTISPECIES: hypothetical protein [Haloferax]KAB1188243.1 hypothetical protein Hfx1149_09445 [Haloferax sp. CBA1149]MRW80926.1 hypothetical protein [Haloferax marinisediminis]
MTPSTLVDRIRQPEYTGENRCTPCTVVNVVIAAIASLVLGIVWAPLAIASFALFVGVIYTRGYLVPGTPTLTKTYLPDRVLRWFDKEPAPGYEVGTDSGAALDVEAVLQGAQVLEECEDEDDLCLTADFEAAWNDELRRTDESVARRRLAALVGVDETDLSLEDHGRWIVPVVDGTQIGRWESQGALVADMAADRVLEDRISDWAELTPDQRSTLARGVRVYLETCPDCGGDVRFTEETAESCCRSWEVLTIRCTDCEARFFEASLDTFEEEEAV